MIARRRTVAAAAAAIALLVAGPAAAQEKLKVVATFSILADLMQNVGGERIAVTTLVGPNSDAHVYSPSPADARTLAGARVVVVNGLGLEGWLDRLVKASATKAAMVVATKGVKTRRTAGGHGHGHGHADVDPHAWQSIANAKVYVANIRDALVTADADGKAAYEANAMAYVAKLDALEKDIKAAVAAIPADRRKIITNHDAFGYFAAAYGITFVSPQGVTTESEPSARDVAKIIGQIKKQKIPAVFLENVTDSRLLRRIGAETGARIGGTLYSDALTDAKGDAPTYIDMMRHNIKTLSAALMS
jgi:zinc/manganese transport system substrate-binding protein